MLAKLVDGRHWAQNDFKYYLPFITRTFREWAKFTGTAPGQCVGGTQTFFPLDIGGVRTFSLSEIGRAGCFFALRFGGPRQFFA